MKSLPFYLLKAALVVLVFVSLIVQFWLLPELGRTTAYQFPELAAFRLPYVVLFALVVLCGQTALFAVWKLLSRTARGKTFERSSLRWVDTMIWSGIAASALILGGWIVRWIMIEPAPDYIWFATALAITTAFSLLVYVLRQLLVSAINQSQELEQVI